MKLAYFNLLNGPSQLVRLANGQKSILLQSGSYDTPRFPNWANKELVKFANKWEDLESDTPVVIHTGLSNIIVLDFDTEKFNIALELNDSLSPELRCTNIVKSIDKHGGHFVYEYSHNELTEYIKNPNGRKLAGLDTLCGSAVVFAPTKVNKTKEIICKSERLVKMPLAMQYLVINDYMQKVKVQRESTGKDLIYHKDSKLAILAMRIFDSEPDLYGFLAKVAQPRHKELMAESDKELPDLHPDRIPDGEGYNFLQSISGALMLDQSIDKDLHKKILMFLNGLYSIPIDPKRVLALWESDCAKPAYRYNPNWNTQTYSRNNRENEVCEYYAYLEDSQYVYYKINTALGHINKLRSKLTLAEDITVETTKVEKPNDIISKVLTLDEVISVPYRQSGILRNISGRLLLNTYVRNIEQETFYEPHKYFTTWTPSEQAMPYNESHPRWPKITLGALTNACGKQLQYFLAFMARKYRLIGTSKGYSPLFFVFYGVPHSFKTGVVDGVFTKLSAGRHQTLQPKVLLDKYNAWVKNMDLVLLDEIHHLTKLQLAEAIGSINTLTGTQEFTGLRGMYQEASSQKIPNTLTFIVCTNETVQLTTELNDRRMVVFKADKRVSEALNLSDFEIRKGIQAETINFAYYLSTQIPDLDDDMYTTNKLWKTDTYESFQQATLKLEDKLAVAIETFNYVEFLDLFMELGGNEDYFNSCVEILTGNRVNIRLFNSRPDITGTPGLFDNTANNILNNFNVDKFKKRLNLIPHVSKYVNDVVNGNYTGNKKCVWKLDLKDYSMRLSTIGDFTNLIKNCKK